jgi:quinol monooxygenase YgiN
MISCVRDQEDDGCHVYDLHQRKKHVVKHYHYWVDIHVHQAGREIRYMSEVDKEAPEVFGTRR